MMTYKKRDDLQEVRGGARGTPLESIKFKHLLLFIKKNSYSLSYKYMGHEMCTTSNENKKRKTNLPVPRTSLVILEEFAKGRCNMQ